MTGKFFDIIAGIYQNDISCIKVNGKLSPTFKATSGVKQGCILSPLLFNIFMADLPDMLNQNDNVQLSQQIKTNCIIWADDILILSETEEGLNKSLQGLAEYCKINELNVNKDKTKCMIFNKTGRLMRRHFYLGATKLETVNAYKYLGLVVTPSGEIKSALEDLRGRALKAYMGLKYKLGTCFQNHIEETCKLFDSLVKPILLYASDFWGCIKPPANNPIENLHSMFCKHLLGVHKSTTNVGVLLELGRTPLMLDAQKASIKNWARISNSNTNILTKASYDGALAHDLDWNTSIRTSITHCGLCIKEPCANKNLYKDFSKRKKDIFIQNSIASLHRPDAKLRTYGLIKDTLSIEKYLTLVRNIKHRVSLSRFRLSNHKLMIEVGRHNKPKKLEEHQRVCPLCPHACIENEIHFLTSCKAYETLRKSLYDQCAEMKTNFTFYTDEQKFKFIMSCEYLSVQVAKFVHNAMNVRSEIIENN